MGCIMSDLRCLFASTAFVFTGAGAFAQGLDQDTACRTVVKLMAASSPDQQKVKEILDYALQTMQDVDRLHRLGGQIEIFSQMPEKGRSSIASIVVDRCRSHKELTLADTATETYEAIRTMRTSLALNAERRKLARRALAGHRLAPAVLADSQETRSVAWRSEDDL
jgi:hypothetical protein